MNNKGQALIEFILILPLFLMILFVMVDFGVIFSSKSKLENSSYDIVELLNDGTSIEEIRSIYPDLEVNLIVQNSYMKLSLDQKVDLITPGLNRILEDPYPISVERVIPYET